METGPDGKVVLELRPGQYVVQVSAPGFAIQAKPVTVEAGTTTSLFFQLEPLKGYVEVAVVDDRGAPVVGASVEPTLVG